MSANANTKLRCKKLRTIAGLLLIASAPYSYAAVSCTGFAATSANFAYVANTNNGTIGQSGVTNNVVQNNVSFTCTRTGALTPSTVAFGVTNGNNLSGGTNRARFAGPPISFVSYNTFKDSGCSQTLNDGGAGGVNRFNINLNAALGVVETINVQFYTCISASQTLTSFPAGVYEDDPNMNLRYAGGGAAIDRTAKLNVSINAPAFCSINGLPASNTIPLTYTAFQNTAAFNFASFNAACTNLLPYTMAVSPTSGVVGGLNYQLGLSSGLTSGSATNIGTTPLNDIGGSSGTKMHYINAVMQAGQAGQVGAPLSNGHTLTITY